MKDKEKTMELIDKDASMQSLGITVDTAIDALSEVAQKARDEYLRQDSVKNVEPQHWIP